MLHSHQANQIEVVIERVVTSPTYSDMDLQGRLKAKANEKKNDLTKVIIIKLSCVSDQAIISFQTLKSIYFWRFFVYESQLKKYIRSEEKYFQLTQNYTRNVHSSTMKTNQIMSNNLNEFRKNCTIIFTGNQGSFLSEIVPIHSNLISKSLYNWNFIKTEI